MKARVPCPRCGGRLDVTGSGSYEERKEKCFIKDLKKQRMGMGRRLGLESIALRLAAEMPRSEGLQSVCMSSHELLGNLASLRLHVLCCCYPPTNTASHPSHIPTKPPKHNSSPASFSSPCRRERIVSGSPRQPGRHWRSSGGERTDLGVHSRFSPGSCKLEGSRQRKGEHLKNKARERL